MRLTARAIALCAAVLVAASCAAPRPGDRDAAALVRAWAEAYNAHDLDALIACYGDAATNTQHPWQRTVAGRDAVRAVYARTFQAFPDIRIAIRELVAEGDRVAITWEFSGTMLGAFAGHAPSGRRFALNGCEIFALAGGRIADQQGYWDRDTMFRQLALADAP